MVDRNRTATSPNLSQGHNCGGVEFPSYWTVINKHVTPDCNKTLNLQKVPAEIIFPLQTTIYFLMTL